MQWNLKLTAAVVSGEVVVGDAWSNTDPPLTSLRDSEPATFTQGSDSIPVKSNAIDVVKARLLTVG